MAFFVVQRGSDSVLSIPLPEPFATREAAIAALSAATGSGELVLTGEVFIADLSTAVPVLLVQPAAPAQAVEIMDPADEVAEVAAAAVGGGSPVVGFGDDASLAAALKRAASTLEDEGIVAPASIESAPEGEGEEPEVEAVEEAPAAEAPEAEEPEAAEPSWPWTNVEAYSGEDVPSDEVDDDGEDAEPSPLSVVTSEEEASEPESDAGNEDALTATVAEPMGVSALEDDGSSAAAELDEELYALTGGNGELAEEDQPIITSAPLAGEEAYVPRPVILGDYGDSTPVEGEADVLAESPAPAVFESVAVEASTVVAEYAPAVETGYEAAGDLDLGSYTCQDCVYSNTCPKVGEATPADCGSFQWRAE